MRKNKPYIKTARQKNPTIEHDATAYASGSNKSFSALNSEYVKSVETVDLAIRTIANVVSLCKMQVKSVKEDGTEAPLKIKNVDFDFFNENDSRVDFFRKMAVNIWSQGATLVVTESAKRGKLGKMTNFYNLDMSKVTAKSSGTTLISEFVYKAEDGSEIIYPAEKCIYVNDSIDPTNLVYSLSRLKSLNDMLLMQAGIVGQAKEMLTGGSKKASIISADAPISETNMKKIKVEFDKFMQSGTSSSLFMNTKLDVTPIGNAMTGKELLELLTSINETVLKHFAIPSFLLGVTSKGANKTEEVTLMLRTFFNAQLSPVLTNIELHFTRFFREQLGVKDAVVTFNYNDLNILKMPEEIQVELTTKKHKAGLITLNEARAMLELPPREDEAADKIFMPAYLLGNAPVSYDNYTTDLERMMNVNSVSGSTPSGNAGGADNTNVVSDSRGGSQDG